MKAKAMKKTLSCILALTLTASMMAESLTAFAANDGVGAAQTADAPGDVEEDAVNLDPHPTTEMFKVGAHDHITAITISTANTKNFVDNTDGAIDLTGATVTVAYQTATSADGLTYKYVTAGAAKTWTGDLSLFVDGNGDPLYKVYTTVDGNTEFTSIPADQTAEVKEYISLTLENTHAEVSGDDTVVTARTGAVDDTTNVRATNSATGGELTIAAVTLAGIEIVPENDAIYSAGENLAHAFRNAKYRFVRNSGKYDCAADGTPYEYDLVLPNGFDANGNQLYKLNNTAGTTVASAGVGTITEISDTPVTAIKADTTTQQELKFQCALTALDVSGDGHRAAIADATTLNTGVTALKFDVTADAVKSVGFANGDKYNTPKKNFVLGDKFELGNKCVLEVKYNSGNSKFIASKDGTHWFLGDTIALATAYTAVNSAYPNGCKALTLVDKAADVTAADKLFIDFDSKTATENGTAALTIYGYKDTYSITGITVADQEVDSISFAVTAAASVTAENKPTSYAVANTGKLTFATGEKFAVGKGDVTYTITYKNGNTATGDLFTDIALFEFSTDALITAGESNFEVTLAGTEKTANIPIKVAEDAISVSIEMSSEAQNLYYVGEDLNTEGITVTVSHLSPQGGSETKTLAEIKADTTNWDVKFNNTAVTAGLAANAKILEVVNKTRSTKPSAAIKKIGNAVDGAAEHIYIVDDYVESAVVEGDIITSYYVGTSEGGKVMYVPASAAEAFTGGKIILTTAKSTDKTDVDPKEVALTSAKGTANATDTTYLHTGDTLTLAKTKAGDFAVGTNEYTVTYRDKYVEMAAVAKGTNFADVTYTAGTADFKIAKNLTGIKLEIAETKGVVLDTGAEIKKEDLIAYESDNIQYTIKSESIAPAQIDVPALDPTTDADKFPKTKFNVGEAVSVNSIGGGAESKGQLVITYNNGKVEKTAIYNNAKLSLTDPVSTAIAGTKSTTLKYTVGEEVKATIPVSFTIIGKVVKSLANPTQDSTTPTAGTDNIVPAFYVGDTEFVTDNYYDSNLASGIGAIRDNDVLNVSGYYSEDTSDPTGVLYNLLDEDDFALFDYTGFDTSMPGDVEITATLKTDSTLSFKFKVRVLVNDYAITLINPDQLNYIAGEDLDPTGGKITIKGKGQNDTLETYTLTDIIDGKYKTATAECTTQIKATSALTAGTEEAPEAYTWTVQVFDATRGINVNKTFTTTVVTDHIGVFTVKQPDTTEYFTGETVIDWTGADITYSTVNYPNEQKHIYPSTVAACTETAFPYAGAKIMVNYTDAAGDVQEKEITKALKAGDGDQAAHQANLEAAFAQAGTTTVTIIADGKKFDFPFTVTASADTAVVLGDGETTKDDNDAIAAKVEFPKVAIGQNLDISQIKGELLITDNQGSKRKEAIQTAGTLNSKITLSKIDNTKAGNQTITMTYKNGDFTKTFDITVTVTEAVVQNIELSVGGTKLSNAAAIDANKLSFFLGSALKFAKGNFTAEVTYVGGATATLDFSDDTIWATSGTDKMFTISNYQSAIATSSQTLLVTYNGAVKDDKTIELEAKYTVSYDKATLAIDSEVTATPVTQYGAFDGNTDVDFGGRALKVTFADTTKETVNATVASAMADTTGVWAFYIDNEATPYSKAALKDLDEGEHVILAVYKPKTNALDSNISNYNATTEVTTYYSADTTHGANGMLKILTFNVVDDIATKIEIKDAPAVVSYTQFTDATNATILTALQNDTTFSIKVTKASGDTDILKVKPLLAAGATIELEEAFDANTVGTYYAIVKYQGQEARQAIEIKEKAVDKIVISTEPTYKTYGIGQSFDATAMVITVKFVQPETGGPIADKTLDAAAITDELAKTAAQKPFLTLTGFDTTTAGESKSATFTYGGKTATLDYSVVEGTLNSLEITALPKQKIYKTGDFADLSEAKIKAKFTTTGTVAGGNAYYFINEVDIAKLDGITMTVGSLGAAPAVTNAVTFHVAKYDTKELASAVDVAYSAALTSAKTFVTFEANTPKSIKIKETPKTDYYLAYTSKGATPFAVAADKFDKKTGSLEVAYLTSADTAEVSFGDTTATGLVTKLNNAAIVNDGAMPEPTTDTTYTVSVEYQENSLPTTPVKTSYEINVKKDAVKSIAVTAPTKTTYVQGMNFDLTGAKVTVTMESGRKITGSTDNVLDLATAIDNGIFTISSTVAEGTGEQEVTVTYTEGAGESAKAITDKFTVSIVENVLESVAVKTQPKKLAYTTMDTELDLTGAVLTLTYEGVIDPKTQAKTKDVELTAENIATYNITCSAVDFTKVGEQEVTITVDGNANATAKIAVTVTEAVPTSIKINDLDGALAPKTIYNLNGTIDTSVGSIIVTYDNDTTGTKAKVVPLSDATVTVTGDLTKVGKEVELTVTYTEGTNPALTTTYKVEVTDKVVKTFTLTPPTKLAYKVGETFSYAGATATVVYDGEAAETVTYDLTKDADLANLKITITDKAGTTVSAVDTTAAGEYTVKVALVEDETKFDSFKVTVTAITADTLTLNKDALTIKKGTSADDLMKLAATVIVTITYSEGEPFTASVVDPTAATKITVAGLNNVNINEAGTYPVTVTSIENPTLSKTVTITVVASSLPTEEEIGETVTTETKIEDKKAIVDEKLPTFDPTATPVVVVEGTDKATAYATLTAAFDSKNGGLDSKSENVDITVLIYGKVDGGTKKLVLPKKAKAIRFLAASDTAELDLTKLTAINVATADVEFNVPVKADKSLAITVGKGRTLTIGELVNGEDGTKAATFGAIKGNKDGSVLNINANVTVASIATFATVNTAPGKKTTIADKGSIKTVGKLEGEYRLGAKVTVSGVSVTKAQFDVQSTTGKITLDKVSYDAEKGETIGLVYNAVDAKWDTDENFAPTKAILYTKIKNDNDSAAIVGIKNNEDLSAVAYGTELRAEDRSTLTVAAGDKEDLKYSTFEKLFNDITAGNISGDITVTLNKEATIGKKAKFPSNNLTSLTIDGNGYSITSEVASITASCDVTIKNVKDIKTTKSNFTLNGKKNKTLTIENTTAAFYKISGFTTVKADNLVIINTLKVTGLDLSGLLVVQNEKAAVTLDTLTAGTDAAIGFVATAKKMKTVTIKTLTLDADDTLTLKMVKKSETDDTYEDATTSMETGAVVITDKSKAMTAAMFDATALKGDGTGALTAKSGKFTLN